MATYLEPLRVAASSTSEQIAAVAGVLVAHPGRCLLPVPEGDEGERIIAAARVDEPLGAEFDAAVLAVATTGSTGTPKIVLHSRASLMASINATADYLGGHGQWVLCLGINHIAGIQVVLRSAVAGAGAVACSAGGADFANRFVAAVEQLSAATSYVSLVPTQLHRLMESGCVAALRRLSAVLLGGAAADPQLLQQCAEARINVVTTYGMSETGGGCIYDGTPLPGVAAELDADGIITLRGPVVALGYRDPIEPRPFMGGSTAATHGAHATLTGARYAPAQVDRAFRTSDLGTIVDGHLKVAGRSDDLINTGGKKVSPQRVEAALLALPEVGDVLVVGVPDAEWGERVVALLVEASTRAPVPRPGGPQDHAALIRGRLRSELPSALSGFELPRDVVLVPELPLKGIGKPDRAAARDIAIAALTR